MTQESPLDISKRSEKFRRVRRTLCKLKAAFFLKCEKNGRWANHKTAFYSRRRTCLEREGNRCSYLYPQFKNLGSKESWPIQSMNQPLYSSQASQPHHRSGGATGITGGYALQIKSERAVLLVCIQSETAKYNYIFSFPWKYYKNDKELQNCLEYWEKYIPLYVVWRGRSGISNF